MAQRKAAKKDKSTSTSGSKGASKSKKSKASGKRSAAARGLSESDRALLRSLPSEFAERPDFSVATILDEARELDVTTKKLGAELVKGTASPRTSEPISPPAAPASTPPRPSGARHASV